MAMANADTFRSPYGVVTIQWEGGGLKSLHLGPYAPLGGAQIDGVLSQEPHPLFRLLNDYFRGAPVSLDVPLHLEGHSLFDRLVWAAVRRIPYGQVRTYGGIAQEIGKWGAARAVGGALSRNPFALVVPCHRVVGSNGKLMGFGAGVPWKQALLNLEGIEICRGRVSLSGL
ncbi:MAG: methylated-DNA--[protein]-cysteine S-methyltransferase [Candidatus Latescibacterota bacterium]